MTIDFLIFDGAEDPFQTFDQYNFFLPYIHKGSVVVLHDWYTEKTKLVKTVFDNASEWECKALIKPPYSVGMAVFMKI